MADGNALFAVFRVFRKSWVVIRVYEDSDGLGMEM